LESTVVQQSVILCLRWGDIGFQQHTPSLTTAKKHYLHPSIQF
jgi:hypothetical protein